MRNSDFMRSLRWILVAVLSIVGALWWLQRRQGHDSRAQAEPSVASASNAAPEPAFEHEMEPPQPTHSSDDSAAPGELDRRVVSPPPDSTRRRAPAALGNDRVRAPIELEGRVFGRGYDLTDAKAVVVQKPRNSFMTTSKVDVDEWGRFTWSSKLSTGRTESVSVSIDHPTMRCRPVVIPIDVPDERWNSDEPIRLEVELQATATCTLHGVARAIAPDGRITKLHVCELRDGQPVLPALASLEYGRVRETTFEVDVPIQATYAIVATSWSTRPATKVVEVGAVRAMDVGVLEVDDGAQFSGTFVVDGQPLANAQIVAHLGGFDFHEAGLGSVGLVWSNGEFEWKRLVATTNARGGFSFNGATLGDYQIEFGQGDESVCVARTRIDVTTPVDSVVVGSGLRRIDVALLGRTSVAAEENMSVIDRTQDRVERTWAMRLDATGRATFYAELGSRISLSYNEIERHSFTVRDHERITLDVSSKD